MQAQAGKFGMGAAIAISVGIDRTEALIKNGAGFTSNVDDVTLLADSKNTMSRYWPGLSRSSHMSARWVAPTGCTTSPPPRRDSTPRSRAKARPSRTSILR